MSVEKAKILTIVVAIVGIVLMIVGAMATAPMGENLDETNSNPRVPGGTAVLLLGVVILTSSPLVYATQGKGIKPE